MTKFRSYFKNISEIGRGNFAKVYLVKRNSNSKQYAVKVFNKKIFLEDENEKKCILYEIEMMQAVNHPRILKLVELYEGENHVYCVCEHYKGQDLLQSIIDNGIQPEEISIIILKQILEGLVYLSKKKIIHRDIKPENILFKHEKGLELGIVDLGFATYEKDYKNLFVRCGTPGFVGPEVLNDKPYDCRTDVFSAGIIFYLL